MVYDFKSIEAKWQKRWEKEKAFESKIDKKKPKYYVLEMFPYPSGAGLHMGHALNYTIGDIVARFMRMKGFNVLYPMGYDSFGLPAENAAIKAKEHPKTYTENAIKNFIKQQKSLGLSYDWDRMISTSSPEYYKWNQYFFLKFLEKGLVYKKRAQVNWCPKCDTVLANEQVHNGKCWRHEDTDVEIKPLEQWFIKTTEYANELLEIANDLQWPERIKLMQKNWIGKSYGTEIDFGIESPNKEIKKWPIFTTRPDTIYGVTFMVISAQHERLQDFVTKEQSSKVKEFLRKLKGVSEKNLEDMEKEGVFTGSYAINPLTNEKVPIYAGNFVVADYGSGMVMAVPAHDQRDFEFAKKYKINVKEVIAPVFETLSGPDALKKDLPIKKRKTAVCIVKHWSDDKYLCLEWKKEKWKTFVVGGVDEEEDIVKAGIREIKEETGYQNIKFVKYLGGEIHNKFFASHKKENRWAVLKGLYFELTDSKKKEVDENESNLHKAVWVEKNKVSSFLYDDQSDQILWRRLNGLTDAYTGRGNLVNSKEFNDLDNEEAKKKITEYLEKKKIGRKVVNFKFRDWLISRQRYWGTPIPIINCSECGPVPVPEKDLPVKLPDKIEFGKGNPLETNESWLKVKCPKCNKSARRETDTMDTFFDSSWYYLRYTDNKNDKKPFSEKEVKYWMTVDQYIGGAEHACMHLIYARFFTKALRDLGMLDFDEPFTKLFNQGMLHATEGEKMSKSKGNTIDPLDIVKKYSADSLRLALMSFATPDKDTNWDEKVLIGSYKFLNKVADYFEKLDVKKLPKKSSPRIESKYNKTLKEVTKLFEEFRNNLAIIRIRELFTSFDDDKNEASKEVLEGFLKILHPVCPHVSEEFWEKLGNKNLISLESWPKAEEKKINENFEKQEQVTDKTVSDIINVIKILKEKQNKDAEKVFVYVLPNEKEFLSEDELSVRTGKPTKVFSVNDKNKYDPEDKSKKVKPGRPGIYLE